MPIAGFGLLTATWTIDRKLTTNRLADFVKVLNRALHEFEFSEHTEFTHTIHLNTTLVGSNIATYDAAKCILSFVQYKAMLEALIDKANYILIVDKKYTKKYRNHKFDVTGNWDDGEIIIISR